MVKDSTVFCNLLYNISLGIVVSKTGTTATNNWLFYLCGGLQCAIGLFYLVCWFVFKDKIEAMRSEADEKKKKEGETSDDSKDNFVNNRKNN